MSTFDEKKEVTYHENGDGYDGRRRGSRIDGPIRKNSLGVGDTSSDEEGNISVAKQIELEKGNAIQYRTCSWPKV